MLRLLHCLALAGVALSAEVAVADVWKPISIGRYFTFEAPVGTKLCPDSAKPEDSIVAEFCGPGFRTGFDYGPWSNDLSGFAKSRHYVSEHLSIDGRQALMVTGLGEDNWGCTKRIIAIYLVVSRGYERPTMLEMHGCAATSEKIEQLHRLFQSLKFTT